jgi:hypothetical protein
LSFELSPVLTKLTFVSKPTSALKLRAMDSEVRADGGDNNSDSKQGISSYVHIYMTIKNGSRCVATRSARMRSQPRAPCGAGL